MANRRQGTHKAKERGEVSGSKYPQAYISKREQVDARPGSH